MLSGSAAEKEDSPERGKGQSPINQPSGTELSLNTLEITELPLNQPSGTELSLNLSSGTELSHVPPSGVEPSTAPPSGIEPSIVPPSGIEPLIVEPSGTEPLNVNVQPSGTVPAIIQTSVTVPSDTLPLPLVQAQEATDSVRAPDTMPVFTGLLPGKFRLLPPRKGKVTTVVTMSSQGESTIRTPTTTTQVEKGTRPMISGNTPERQAPKDALVHRQCHGEPDSSSREGIPIDMMLAKDGDGVGRLKMINKSKDNQIKSKDKQKTVIYEI
jgi:hypothetical protein